MTESLTETAQRLGIRLGEKEKVKRPPTEAELAWRRLPPAEKVKRIAERRKEKEKAEAESARLAAKALKARGLCTECGEPAATRDVCECEGCRPYRRARRWTPLSWCIRCRSDSWSARPIGTYDYEIEEIA